MRKLLFAGLLVASAAWGQISNAPALLGQKGTTTPTNCQIGQLFFDTNATAGQNVYGCTSANTWTLQGGAGGGDVSVSGTPTSGQYARWTDDSTIEGVDLPSLTGTPAAGDLSYWTSSTEQALATAATGLFLRQGTSAPITYAGTSCTNQFPRSLNASGAATCASVSVSADVTGTLAVANGGTNATTAQNAAKSLGTQWILGKAGIPFIIASSGSIGDNCAITAMTATAVTYANAYIYLPADAISAGSAAGWYFFQGSSTTAGTCFNNTYTSGLPTIPGSPTAFATTGPGAFVGDTTTRDIISVSLPANSLGNNGCIGIVALYSNNNSAGTKTYNSQFGGTNVYNNTATTTTVSRTGTDVCNRGEADLQVASAASLNNFGVAGGTNPQVLTNDTTGAVTVAIRGGHGTATDHIVLESWRIIVYADGN